MTALALARGNADRPQDTRQYAQAQPLGITTNSGAESTELGSIPLLSRYIFPDFKDGLGDLNYRLDPTTNHFGPF